MKKYPIKGLEKHGRRWRWRRMIEGRRISHTFDAASEAEAIAIAQDLETRPEIRAAGAWEFAVRDYIERAIAAGTLSPGYGAERGRALLEEGKRLRIGSPEDLTRARLRAWYEKEWSGSRLKESTVAHYLNHFRGLFKDLVSRNRLRESPLAGMTLHRAESNERDVFLTAPQVASLRAAARAHWKKENARTSGPRSPRWRETPSLELVLLLGAECGMRHGEFDAARPDWLDLEGGILNIPPEDHFEPGRPWKRKGRRGNRRPAVVPIPQVVKDWFAEFGTGGDYLLAPWKSWGKGKYRFEIAASWRRFMIREGFPGVTLHDLRRSFGSNRVSAGTSIEKVANWLGIDPKTALARYARFIPADREIEKGSSGEAPLSAEPPALADRLDKLRELRDGGIISEKEEAARRLEILREV